MICTYLTILFDICRPDASFEALKQKLESVMPASGSEQGAEASEAGTNSANTSLPRPAPAASTTAQGSVPVNPQESITANTDIRPVFAHSTSVDQSLEGSSAQGNLLTTGFGGKEAWRPTLKWNTRFFFAFSKKTQLWLP